MPTAAPRTLSPRIRNKTVRRYVAFDIETAKVTPAGDPEWKNYRPLGISCASTVCEGDDPLLWFGRTPDGQPADRMSPADVTRLVAYLQAEAADGATLLSWNGLGFDFDILGEESGLVEPCRQLALKHVDMMFHIFCMLGYPISLDTAAHGMRLPGKTKGIDGALAPRYWAEGRRREILEYVGQDARTTRDVCHAVEAAGCLNWVSGRGRSQSFLIPDGWLTVEQAMRLPVADNSWMDRPMDREKFTGWLVKR
jgi:hypothetical protein